MARIEPEALFLATGFGRALLALFIEGGTALTVPSQCD
jgi:hypothetical protein